MFSENDRISQRQMERQIVLVLLCPAFWQLAAYGASDGLLGMAGIFVGYELLAVWCIYLVRLGGLYCRLESVMGKAGKLLLAVMYLCYLLFFGGQFVRNFWVGRIKGNRRKSFFADLVVCASDADGVILNVDLVEQQFLSHLIIRVSKNHLPFQFE